jgi:hypothetical protein
MTKAQRTTSATFGGSAITSITDVSVTEQSNGSTVLHTDAADAAQAVFVDGVFVAISITSSDLTFRDTLEVGSTGSVVIVRTERANGSGDGSEVMTETYAECAYTGCTDNAGTAGASTVTYNFTGVASDGAVGSLKAITVA